MERLRIVLATIQKHLGGLNATHRLLIGCLAVIMLMTLFLVSQYAGSPSLVELLPTAAPAAQQRAVAALAASGLGVKEVAGKAMVPSDNRQSALAVLNQSGQMPSDTTLIFENFTDKVSWINSKDMNRSILLRMLENELAGVLAKHAGISAAKVFLDVPEPTGIGAGVALPKAAVTLFSSTGGAVDQKAVDAAARLVAGAVARLDLSRVVINDGTVGGPRQVTDDSQMAPTTARDAAQLVERQFQDRIRNLVRHIDGVVVEVTAMVDVKRRQEQETQYLEPKKGTVSVQKSERSMTDTETVASRSAEPGLRSNTSASINAGPDGGGTKSAKSETDTENEVKIGSRVSQTSDPGGTPISLVATVNIPRAFIIGTLAAEKAAAAGTGGTAPAAPTETEIQDRFKLEEASIQKSVTPHLQSRIDGGQVVPGEVVVALVAGQGSLAAGMMGSPAGASGPNGGGTLGTILALGSGVVDKVVLGALAVVALGMMLLMVKRAGRRVEMPSAEELAGVPPSLTTKTDLVGEADESETAIEGIEVGDEEIKAGKLREQVSDLIKKSPETAVAMLNRWVTTES